MKKYFEKEPSDDDIERQIARAHRGAYWAGHLLTAGLALYGAVIALDGAMGAAEEVYKANGGSEITNAHWLQANHAVDGITPDVVTDPAETGMTPVWHYTAQMMVGGLVAIAGVTLKEHAPLPGDA